MKSETWLDQTSRSIKPRSKELKGIDKALTAYHAAPSNERLRELRLAIHHWKVLKGYDAANGSPAWMISGRNSRKAVETLDLQAFGVTSSLDRSIMQDLGELPFYGIEAWAGEGLAKDILKEARQQALPLLFMGRKVVLRKTEVGMAVRKIKKSLASATTNAAEAKAAATAGVTQPVKDAAMAAVRPTLETAERIAQEIIDQILDHFPSVAEELMKQLTELIPNFMTELATAVLPYLSLVPSGNKAIKNTVKTCLAQYNWMKAQEHQAALGGGDPAAAAAALIRMIERKRNEHARLAAAYATDVTVKASSIAADAAAFGAPTVSAVVTPLQGFATAVAVLSQRIFLLARDIHEMRKANKVLTNPSRVQLSAEVFNKCPLMGCYFISCSNTSDILNFIVEDIGSPGWQIDVEVMVKKHISPLVELARDVVKSSRMEIEGMQMAKGAVSNLNSGNAISRWCKGQKRGVVNRIKSALPFVDDTSDYRVFAQKQQGREVVSPAVLKSRITGFGSQGA